uniref:Uncharacterized protein n=1 Tax=Arundo donax TaxID=35708 RepID=A0A0A9AAT8_ARUDO
MICPLSSPLRYQTVHHYMAFVCMSRKYCKKHQVY